MEFASGGGDATQAKGKKLDQGVSMKSLKELTSRWSFKENCNESKSCRTTTARVHLSKIRDDPRHGGESAKGPGRGGKVKGFTILLQPRKEL